MRKLFIILAGVFVSILTFLTIASIFLCEGTLHLAHKPLTGKMQAMAEQSARQLGVKMENVQVTSFDGVTLRGWFFRPEQGNGDVVIVLHGHGDNRAGMAGFVPLLLRHHYAVLAPDSRAHGESGGEIATFGLYESRDLSRWVDWLNAQHYQGCIYGLGESMGAAILLQALPNEPRLCAGVAESPYATFREVAYDRLARRIGGGLWARRLLCMPLVSEAFLYARLRYGIDFDQDSPARAMASPHAPVLLIHGMEDFNIPLRHCETILNHHAGLMEFWQVPGARHTGAFSAQPEEFEHRVTEWFTRFSRQ